MTEAFPERLSRTSHQPTSPTDRPAAPSSAQPYSPVSRPSLPTREATTAHPSGAQSSPASAHPARVGRRSLARLGHGLDPEDRLLLEEVQRHRYVTSQQVEALCFRDRPSQAAISRAASRALYRLERAGLIRPLATRPRQVGGPRGGSSPRIWHLREAGSRLLAPDQPRRRHQEPSDRFLDHCLAVAETHIRTRAVARELSGSCHVVIEPRRRVPGVSGGATPLRPDLLATITAEDAEGSYEDRWFIEVDRGTESLPTVLGKCQLYRRYYQSGIEQLDGHGFPLVLWLMQGHRAQARASELVRQLDRKQLTPELFRVTTDDGLAELLRTGGAA